MCLKLLKASWAGPALLTGEIGQCKIIEGSGDYRGCPGGEKMFDAKKCSAFIKESCLNYKGRDPLALAIGMMAGEQLRPHGPEHHFMVAAALCSAWCNAMGEEKEQHLEHLEERCRLIYPGVCGYFGVCGDTLAAGAAYSEMEGVNYLSGKPWRDIALFTGKLQQALAASCLCGPRCCKRSSFAVLSAAAKTLKDWGLAPLELRTELICGFSERNSQCIKKACIYYGKDRRAE